MKYAEWTERARERTAPRPDALARVRGRIDRQLLPATAELASLPKPRPGAAQRVKARLEQRPVQRPWPALAAGAALMATATAIAIGLASGGSPAERQLVVAGAGTLAVTDHVQMIHDGRGQVTAVGDGVSIDWEIGRLDLDVDPGQGATVQVHTEEGTVRVVGTKFGVERDAFGTRVDVARGKVSVQCADGTSLALEPSQELECQPITAAGLLNRARAQEERGDPAETLLPTVERGLGVAAASDAVRTELLTLKANALVRAGRAGEAIDAAELALAAGPDPARAAALHRLAARLALSGGLCARAVPHLDALPSLTTEEQAHRERCR